jgi:hypothetical protein
VRGRTGPGFQPRHPGKPNPPPKPNWLPTPDYPAGDPGPPTFRRGAIVKTVHRKHHRCTPPGWWRRWRDDLGPGTVWRCECGREWVIGFTTEGGLNWGPVPGPPPSCDREGDER